MNDSLNFLSHLTVLCVEDEPIIRNSLVEYLSLFFKNIYEAKDGIEGFEVYLEKKPDIVITDILMPRLDGLKLSKEIKNISNETKIIISSAYSDTKYLLEAIEIGVFGYIIKPYNKQQIDDILIKCSDSISYEKNWKSINKK